MTSFSSNGHGNGVPQMGHDDEPDPRLLWQWAGRAARPWIGWLFIGLGALLVLLGYLGVSRESIVEKQIPYLVSGGIGGVLLCVVGAYFLGTAELRQASGRLDRLEAMVQELHGALLTRPDAPAPMAKANGRGEAGEAGAGGSLVAVEGGESFHRAGCRLAAGKQVDELTAADARQRGLRPCPLCDPTAVAAS